MTMKNAKTSEPALLPGSDDEIERVRERCRSLVKKRAAIAAGVAAVPLPGVDLLSDLANFTLLVEEINLAFGLTPEQIDRLHPRMRVMTYEAATAIGSRLVGRLVTREVVMQLFKKSGVKLAAKTVAKVVPLAGQMASAAIGFTMFRQMGNLHVEACVKVARQVVGKGAEPSTSR
jgi:uncharacterized protein (DUF697 family)